MSTLNLERAQPSAGDKPGGWPATKALAIRALVPTGALVIPRLTDAVDPALLRARRAAKEMKKHHADGGDDDTSRDALDAHVPFSDEHVHGDGSAASGQRDDTVHPSASFGAGETHWAASSPVASVEVGTPTVVDMPGYTLDGPPADTAASASASGSTDASSGAGSWRGFGGLSMGTIVAGVAGIVGAGVAMSQGQGSSSGDSSASTLSVRVAAGPLTAGVTIEAFDKDGRLVATGSTSNDGRLQLHLEPGFSGPLLIKATGINGAPTDDTQLIFQGRVDLLAGQKLMVFDNLGAGLDITSSVIAGEFTYAPAAVGVGTTHVDRFEVQSAAGVALLTTSATTSATARETLFDALPTNAAADSVFVMTGASQSLDLSQWTPSSHAEIDRFSLGASSLAHNSLRLTTADVLQADVDLRTAASGWAGLVSEGRHQIVIDGAAGSSVDMADGTWTAAGTTTSNGQTYAIYNSVGAQLLIDADITRLGAVI